MVLAIPFLDHLIGDRRETPSAKPGSSATAFPPFFSHGILRPCQAGRLSETLSPRLGRDLNYYKLLYRRVSRP